MAHKLTSEWAFMRTNKAYHIRAAYWQAAARVFTAHSYRTAARRSAWRSRVTARAPDCAQTRPFDARPRGGINIVQDRGFTVVHWRPLVLDCESFAFFTCVPNVQTKDGIIITNWISRVGLFVTVDLPRISWTDCFSAMRICFRDLVTDPV